MVQPQNISMLEANTYLKKKNSLQQQNDKNIEKENPSKIWNKASEMYSTAVYFNRMLSSSAATEGHSKLSIKNHKGWEGHAWSEPLLCCSEQATDPNIQTTR